MPPESRAAKRSKLESGSEKAFYVAAHHLMQMTRNSPTNAVMRAAVQMSASQGPHMYHNMTKDRIRVSDQYAAFARVQAARLMDAARSGLDRGGNKAKSKLEVLKAVAQLLKEGADPRLAPDALVCCLLSNNRKAVTLLLQHRAPVNFEAEQIVPQYPRGHTPLFYAMMCDRRSLQMVETLIEAGANPLLEPGMLGFVIEEIQETTLPMLKKLLALGFPIDGKDARSSLFPPKPRNGLGRTALWVTVRNYDPRRQGNINKAIAKLLLDRGADPKLAPNVLSTFVDTPAMVRRLLDIGTPVNGAVGSTTPLVNALHASNNESAMMLLNAGADPNLGTPLVTACNKQYDIRLSVVKALLAKGADPNQREKHKTALHYAASSGNPNVVIALLQKGANPNLRDFHGETPLHIAASASLRMATPLVNAGANLNVKSRFGQTPRDIAFRDRDAELVQFLDAAKRSRRKRA
jgi:ankyrin repeat protein